MKVVQVHSNLLDPGCRWAHPDIPSWPTADVMIANSHSCVYGSKVTIGYCSYMQQGLKVLQLQLMIVSYL